MKSLGNDEYGEGLPLRIHTLWRTVLSFYLASFIMTSLVFAWGMAMSFVGYIFVDITRVRIPMEHSFNTRSSECILIYWQSTRTHHKILKLMLYYVSQIVSYFRTDILLLQIQVFLIWIHNGKKLWRHTSAAKNVLNLKEFKLLILCSYSTDR